MATAAALHASVGAFIEELVRSGVRHLCFSPGSRSTPLVLMAAQQQGLKLWMHIDERSAGFFALGLAKALGEPVGLLCSSGTAAANFHPAVVEAYYDRVPLVVMTADRPHELRDSGAPQTIDQIRIFGEHAKWFSDMALPERRTESLLYVRTVAARAVATAKQAPAGPVHLNFPFREPLVPQPCSEDIDGLHPIASSGRPAHRPYVTVSRGALQLDAAQVAELVDDLRAWRRGLIVCGPQRDARLAASVVELAKTLGFPVLADPLSGVRYGGHDATWVIDTYDAFLRDNTFTSTHAPDVVIRFGAMPTSKALSLYLQKHATCRQIVVDEGAGWREPTRLAERVIHADPRRLCTALLDQLPTDLGHTDRSWGMLWQAVNQRTRTAVSEAVQAFEPLFEGRVFTELATLLPRRSTLFVGNSMPVRDLDTFFFAQPASIQCHANRGANGIDGVVSTALGMSAGSKRPVVLVIGDLSFYHDLNGLLAAKRHRLDLTVVLVNNDGGGIFSFLPQAAIEDHFEHLFGTPHGLDFAPAVGMYGGSFRRVADWAQFRAAMQSSFEHGGLNVIEVPTVRQTNHAMHQAVWQAVQQTLRPSLEVRG